LRLAETERERKLIRDFARDVRHISFDEFKSALAACFNTLRRKKIPDQILTKVDFLKKKSTFKKKIKKQNLCCFGITFHLNPKMSRNANTGARTASFPDFY
jgi:hypothetical protein